MADRNSRTYRPAGKWGARSMGTDHYVQSAEIYDILSAQHWKSRVDSIRLALQSLLHAPGTVVDIGAGTGACVRTIADVLPEARILAVEPSPSMRVGLMTRILLDEDLRRRVTVLPTPIQETELPETISAALICGCIGYLDIQERAALWQKLACRVSREGFILADVMPIDRPQAIQPIKAANTNIGDQSYEIWVSGIPGKEDLMLWDMRCDVRQNDHLVRSFHIAREWHTFGIGQLIEEASAAGFRAEPLKNSPVPTAILRTSH